LVPGLNKFKEHFRGYEDQYAVIGGSACDLIFDQAGLDFRATKDIDMVLCVEVVEKAFAERFRAFLEAGNYKARERSNGRREFYRFHKPQVSGFPYMIELFSRSPDALRFPHGDELAAVPVEDDAFSLSAILLDEEYFKALQERKLIVDGVTVINQELLIPFKARAFLDLSERRNRGEKIKRDDIRKHRRDVFRLAQLLREDEIIEVPTTLRQDIEKFLDQEEADGGIDPKTFGVPMTLEEAISLLRSVYQISDP